MSDFSEGMIVAFVIPYLTTPAIHAGPFTISAYGALGFLSIVAGQSLSLCRAVQSGLNEGVTKELILWSTCAGLIGSHLWWLASHGLAWNEIISLQGMVSFGGIFGISACIALMIPRVPRAQVLKWFDAAAYAMVFGLLIGRIGCALEHDHPGVLSTSILAVAFPGESRFDLGLLELVFLALFAVAVGFAGKRIWVPGFLFGAIFILYGVFRIFLDALRVDRAYVFGVAEDVWGGSLMILLGLGGLLLSRQGASEERALPSRFPGHGRR